MSQRIRQAVLSVIAATLIVSVSWTAGIAALLFLEAWALTHAHLLLEHGRSLRATTALMPLFIVAMGVGSAVIGIRLRKGRAARIEQYRNSPASRLLRLND